MAVVAGLVFAPMPVIAQDAPPRLEITPFAAWRGGGEFSDRDTDAGFALQESESFGLTVNGEVALNTQWEVFYARQSAKADPTGTLPGAVRFDMDVEYLHIGGTYLFDGERVQPFIAATVGASRFSPRPDGFSSQTFLSGSFGGGWKLNLGRNLGIRLEARGYATLVDKDNRLFCVSDGGIGTCLIELEGRMLGQWEARAGLTFRF